MESQEGNTLNGSSSYDDTQRMQVTDSTVDSMDTPQAGSSARNGSNGQNESQSTPAAPKRPILREDYFNVNEISALNSLVPCKLIRVGYGLGILDPGLEMMDLPVGTKLELPLWRARDLHARGLLEIEPPRGFSETYREILAADATIVDLHALNANYYLTGTSLAEIGIRESVEIAATMLNTFRQRSERIASHSMASDGRETLAAENRFKNLLDNQELKIYEASRAANVDYRRWLRGDGELSAEASPMVQNLKSRQRLMELTRQSSQPTTSSSSQPVSNSSSQR